MKLALAFLLCAAPLSAQRLDPDWNLTAPDSRQHFAAGVGLGVAGRLILPQAKPWQRLLVTAAIGAAFEVGQMDATERRGPGYGFSPKDLLLDVAGALLVEALWPNRE